MDFIKPKSIPNTVLKPEPVNIISIQVVPIPTSNGVTQSITLMIVGLGDNNIIYVYEGKDKSWREQQ